MSREDEIEELAQQIFKRIENEYGESEFNLFYATMYSGTKSPDDVIRHAEYYDIKITSEDAQVLYEWIESNFIHIKVPEKEKH